jgi:hypothetical protein
MIASSYRRTGRSLKENTTERGMLGWPSAELLLRGGCTHSGLKQTRLAEGEGRGAYGTRNKPANTHSERHDWTL